MGYYYGRLCLLYPLGGVTRPAPSSCSTCRRAVGAHLRLLCATVRLMEKERVAHRGHQPCLYRYPGCGMGGTPLVVLLIISLMAKPQRQSYKDMIRLAQQMIRESEERKARLIGDHDQVTGKGMELHDYLCVIPDYSMPRQWLTKEVYTNPFYQKVMTEGSIQAYIKWFLKEYNMELTAEMVAQQLLNTRLDRDPSFWFAIECNIKHKLTGEMVPFILNYAQRQLLLKLEEMRISGRPIRLVLLKARQWGGSTLVQLYIAWIQMRVMKGWYAIIIAQTKDTARRIKAMYEKAVEEMPAFLYDAKSLKFAPYHGSANDSIVVNEKDIPLRDNVITVASYENYESTRGLDYAMAHFSEVAYWRTTPNKTAEKVITNIDGNISLMPNTLQVIESTANGQAGYFYDEYRLAKKEYTNRKALFVPFYWIENDMLEFATDKEKELFAAELILNKDSDTAPSETRESGQYLWSLWEKGATLEHINWYIAKRKSFHDHGSMAQEAPSDDIECFVYSGANIFSPYIVATLRNKYVKEPLWYGYLLEQNGKLRFNSRNKDNSELRVWRKPDSLETEHQYVVAVDIGGRSEKADFSCITVIDRMPKLLEGGCLEVVARWRGHMRYDRVASLAVKVARYYKNALLVFESNTFDRKKAESRDYVQQGDHIRGVLDIIGEEYKNLYVRAATSPEDIRQGVYTKIGFNTNVKTKQDMVDRFVVLFEDNLFIDPDDMFYDEASIYEQKPNGSYGNKDGDGNHDDILDTNMIACLVEKDMPPPAYVKLRQETYTRHRGTVNESSF